MAEEDRAAFDAVAEGSGSERGAFSMLMWSPALCQRIFDVGKYLQSDRELSPRQRELATMTMARGEELRSPAGRPPRCRSQAGNS